MVALRQIAALFGLAARCLVCVSCGLVVSCTPQDATRLSRQGADVHSNAQGAAAPNSTGCFTEVARAAGIAHTHHKPVLDHKLDNIMSWVASVGAAAAAGDYDNDGWIDLYVTNSHKGTPNFLYRNNGDGTFSDVAQEAGVADLNGENGACMDCVWGDYDNDGWTDLYVVRWGRDALFRNNGNGTFTEVTQSCFRTRDGAPGTDWANGNAAVFFDYNLDGRLDIYVGNYFAEVDLWHLASTRIMHDSFETSRNGGRNFLYYQQPDGTFREVAATIGVDDPGWTLAVGSADVNNDGWPDLYCADDFGPDQLFLNNGDGSFRNVSDTAIGRDSKKGMNVDFGDFNNDGWLDIYVANITTAEYLQEGNMLWHNNGMSTDSELTFTDIGLDVGAYDGGWGWGAKFLDYDNDADLDIVAVNGFVSAGKGNYWYDLASWTVMGQDVTEARNWPTIGDRSFSGYEPERLWCNDGLGSFTERAKQEGFDSVSDGRGVVCFDYDNDGDVDIFIANQGQPPQLFRNSGRPGHHWLQVVLDVDRSTKVNSNGIGTRVTIVTDRGRQIRERDGGNGYCGQSDPRLHFGLGEETNVRILEVRWPDGGLQYLENVPADQVLTIRQAPQQYAGKMALQELRVAPPKPRKTRLHETSAIGPAISASEVERVLSEIEQLLRDEPITWGRASQYRAKCVEFAQHDRSIDFFRKLCEKKPVDTLARLELGCSYVDKIPTCGGIAAIVSKGTLARKSLDCFDAVIATEPNLWVAYYCRAMNHLHWPRALRHSDDAAEDFEKCLVLQAKANPPHAPSYYVRAHIGLGDARAKAGQFDLARQAWQEGLRQFPDSPELQERIAVQDDNELLGFVEEKRSLEAPIDTDLSFLDSWP